MKRKRSAILVIALVVLCVLIGLGIALWYLFGSNPNDGGGNGDDTTTVTPGDPDDEPGTGGNPDDEPGTPGDPDDEPGTPGDPDDEPGTSGNPDDEPGTGGNPDDEPGTPGNPDDEPGTGGNPDDEPGTGGNPDDEPGTPGDPDDELETPHEHTYTSAVTKEPTCTQEGEMTYTCTCGESYTEPVAMIPHTEVIDEAVAPTCTATGLTEGKHCSVCGTVLVEQEVVPTIAHNYVGKETKKPTCTQTGAMTYTCTCGDSYTASTAALGHLYRVTNRQEATCTQEGEVVYTCSRCDDSYTIRMNASHRYELVETVAATCTEAGYQLYRCSECEEEYRNTIPAGGGHDYVGVVTLAPTTEQEGEMTYTCSACGDSYTVPLAKLNSGSGHVLLIQDRLPWTTDNNAVILNYLTESGQIGGWEIETTQQAAALDLSAYGIIYIANDQTTATYDRLGQLNEKLTQFVQGGGVLIYGACDHGWAAGDISYALPGGVSVQNYYSNYNYIVNATHDIITGVLTGGEAITDRILYGTYSSHTTFHGLPAGADILLQDANGDPTLVEYTLGNGYVIASGLTWEYTYERTFVDDTSFAKEIYDDLFVYAQTLVSGCEHEYLAGETVAPTCTEDGYTVYTCTVCGRTYHGDYVTALGHTYTSEETKKPTCEQEGEMTYTCSVCGGSYTESIPMTAHTEVIDAAVAPTCTTTGLTEGKHCSVCGTVLVKQEVIPMTAHNYVDGVCTMCGKPDESYATEGLVFTLSDDGTCYSVTDYTGTATEVYIPAVYNGLSVTSIGVAAFMNCGLTSITIPDSVTGIGNSAFYNCDSLKGVYITDLKAWCIINFGGPYSNPLHHARNLYLNGQLVTELVIPDCVTSIGNYAFWNCTSLTSITIPDSVTSIGDEAFYWCVSLTSVTIGNGVTSIGYLAFYNCYSLTSVTIGNGVTSIGDRAFEDCSSLTSIIIPNSVSSIGWYAFRSCDRLTSITIQESVTSIGDGAFSSTAYYYDESNWVNDVLYIGNHLIEAQDTLSGAYSVKNGTKTIADEAFHDCVSLTSVTIGKGVTSIGDSAFAYCSSLTSITIGNDVTSIGNRAFEDCSSLTSITVANGNPVYHSAGNCLIETGSKTLIAGCKNSIIPSDGSVTSIGRNAFFGCSSLTSITIPDSVTSIGDSAFYKCSKITSVTIGNGVTSIGDGAFWACSSLTSIEIPASVTSIGVAAFRYCYDLASIEIPDSVTSIGSLAFEDCGSLTSVTIPDSVISIGGSAFRGCSSLTSVTFENPNGWWVFKSSITTSGTSISSSALSDPATAAEYLSSTYRGYYWKRG